MTDTPAEEDGNNNSQPPPEITDATKQQQQERPQMSISSDEVNYLIFRYLQECGYVHSAFSFAHESMLGSTGLRSADKTMPPGALVTFLQKGLQYVGIEERLRLESSIAEKGEKGKESNSKKSATNANNHNNNSNNTTNSTANPATPTELSEFSLLSQSAMSAIARRDPPLQLNVPPAAAAAVVKAKLQAEAKMEAERKVAAILADPTMLQQTNNLGSVMFMAGAAATAQQQQQQQPSSQALTTGSATAQQQQLVSGVSLPDHLSNSALARQQQALAAQALQLQQQQQQHYADAEQLAAAEQLVAGAGAPLASLANAFGPRAAADLLSLQQQQQQQFAAGVGGGGGSSNEHASSSTLADAIALASQQQQQQQQPPGPAPTASSQPQQTSTKQSKQQPQGTSASSSISSINKQQRGNPGGGNSSSNGPKRGNKRQKINNEEVQRISDTMVAQQQQQGMADMEIHSSSKKNKNNSNSRGNMIAPHVPSASAAMEMDQQQRKEQHQQQKQQQKEQQQQQHRDFRGNAQQQQQHANMVGHQQEFRPIHHAGQEQFMNGQLLMKNQNVGNGKLMMADHRGGARGMNGERNDNNSNNNSSSNNNGSAKNLLVSRMESAESLSAEDLETDTPQDHILKLEMHESEVFMCAWNPVYTNLIATGSGDASARIWQVGGTKAAAGLTTVKLLPHGSDPRDRKNKDVTTLEWSSDGTLLATGSYDGVARVWARNGALIHTLRGHTGPIFSLKWNKQGNFLLSGSYDKTTIVWDVSGSTGFVEQQFTEHKAPALDVDWKDNTTFASCSTDRSVHICRVGVSRPLKVYIGHSDEVNAVKWDPSGRLLASCSDDCTAKIWDVESDRTDPLYDLKSHEQEIYTVKWSPTGPGSRHPTKKAILATASFDGSVRLWSVADGSCYRVFNRHRDSVYSVAFSPSGDYLASGSLAGQMYVWDIEKAKHIKSYKGKGDIFEVAWNKEETRVAACFSSNVVAIIDFDRPPPSPPDKYSSG